MTWFLRPKQRFQESNLILTDTPMSIQEASTSDSRTTMHSPKPSGPQMQVLAMALPPDRAGSSFFLLLRSPGPWESIRAVLMVTNVFNYVFNPFFIISLTALCLTFERILISKHTEFIKQQPLFYYFFFIHQSTPQASDQHHWLILLQPNKTLL